MKKIVLSAMLFGSTLSMMAGGYLTNTNQSVVFLRNPAQDANINLNGVYSNPAGVNFLQPGFHFGINLQSAYQTREIQSAFKAFEYGIRNNDSASKTFKAEAKAPVIPSLQGAWVNGPLSLQVNLALVGVDVVAVETERVVGIADRTEEGERSARSFVLRRRDGRWFRRNSCCRHSICRSIRERRSFGCHCDRHR